MFWIECKKFFEDNVDSTVDNFQHGSVTHVAKAISVHDLREQVQAK